MNALMQVNTLMPVMVEQTVDPSQLGEVSAAWQITAEALIVLGWRQEKSPLDGSVAHQKPGAPKGRFHSVAWPFPSAGQSAHYFVAALQLPTGAGVQAGQTLLLTGKGDLTGILARLPTRFLDATAFGLELARIAGTSAIAITRFLTQTFSPTLTRGNADIRLMLYSFLERASSPDGCIELVGAVEDHCVVLQGWGGAPGPECDLITLGASIERHTPRLATFSRPDMRGTACGQVLVLPATVSHDLAQIEAVVLLDRRGLRWRPMIRERRLMSGAETIGHLRTALPNLQCDVATRSSLQASLRPRFDGRFTVYDAGHPVRLAVDMAAGAADAGTYLTGWLYDPKAVVAGVQLCSTSGASTLVDTSWTRIIREDVTDAFLNDPSLPRADANQHRHGFAVYVGSISPSTNGTQLYLDVSYRDGQCGFMPLTVNAADNPSTQSRLLATVDLHKPSGLQIIEDHLAPFLFRVAARAVRPEVTVVVPIPSDWVTTLVVPLADVMLPRALLSQFLRDKLVAGEGLAFVCGESWSDSGLDALLALALFYGISPAVIRIQGNVGPASALSTVVSISDTKRLLLLSSGTVGRSVGWRQVLQATLDAAAIMTCVSPTVVYEDESIRYGGTDRVEPLETPPYVHIRRRLAGMPVSIIGITEPKPTVTVSPACCLMPREGVASRGLATSSTATASMQEITLSLMLERNGIKSIWTPAAQVYAADAPPVAAHENTARVGQLVDGWCMRAHLTAKE